MSGPALKPCPFCGGKARMLGGPDAQEIYSVWCVDISCHVHVNGTMNAQTTAEKWNRRPVPPGSYIVHKDEIHAPSVERKFKLGDRVTKVKGSMWTGFVVGFYSTDLTPVGYCVESDRELGSVQIYPEAALRELMKEVGRG